MAGELSTRVCLKCGGETPKISLRCRSCGHESIAISSKPDSVQADSAQIRCPLCNNANLRGEKCLNCGATFESSYIERLRILNERTLTGDLVLRQDSKPIKMPSPRLLLAMFGGIIVIVLSSLLSNSVSDYKKFSSAYASCGNPNGVTIGDSAKTLTINTKGNEDLYGASYLDASCVLDEIGVPQYIRDEIAATNALMGRQTANFDGVTISWSYHPDNGADITLHYGN